MYYGNWGVAEGAGLLGFLTWLVVLADLVLLGVWLLKQLKK